MYETARSGPRGQSAAVPPWPLLWLVPFTLSIPTTLTTVWASYVSLTAAGEFSRFADTTSFTLLRVMTLLGLVPAVIAAAGVVAVVAPGLRSRIIERMFRLAESQRPVVREIETFLREHVRHVQVRANLGRTDRLARVYPAGWRQSRLAVFGPLVVLWRQDRAAAEAVILHEVAHARSGDQLVLGLGSPFVLLLRWWLVVGLVAVPVGVWIVATQPTGIALTAQVLLLLASVPHLMVPAVGALWWSELAADRYVVGCGHRDALLRVLAVPQRTGLPSALLLAVSHPPARLRRWCGTGSRAPTLLLLGGWPLLVFLQLAVIIAAAVPGWLLIGRTPDELPELLVTNSGGYLRDSAKLWASAIVLLALWPAVAPLWTWWWAGGRTCRPAVRPLIHLVVALGLAALFGVALLVT